MNVLEHELEEIIEQYSMTKEGCDKLKERGLPVNRGLLRQVRIGAYGIIDLMSIHAHVSNGNLFLHSNIYELKKGDIGIEALLQLCRYMSGIEHLLKEKEALIEEKHNVLLRDISVSGIAIGKSIKRGGDFVYLYNQMGVNISIYEYSIDVDKGLLFNEKFRGWELTQPEFKDPMLNDSFELNESISIAKNLDENYQNKEDDDGEKIY